MSESMPSQAFAPDRCLATVESGGVQRYHAVPSVLSKQRVDSHAWSVTMIVLCLTDGQASRDLLLHALLHDSAEIVTGDIPFTVKRTNPAMKKLADEMEAEAHADVLFPLPPLPHDDLAVLKIADTLDGWRWCQLHEPRGPVSDRWLGAWRQAREKFKTLDPMIWGRATILFRNFEFIDARSR